MHCRFEIVGYLNTPIIKGKKIYKRLLIRKVKEEDIKEPKDVALLMEYNKKFLIIGNMNTITNKDMFPLIKNNKVWMGATYFNGGAAYFYGDASLYDESKVVDPKHYYVKDGFLFWRVNGVRWFTNLDHQRRHQEIDLYKHYNEEEYPKYDNYSAINVNKVSDIPIDYDGVMGVPVSLLDKYCPEQFEIIWQASGNTRACAPKDVLEQLNYHQHKEDRGGCCVINGKRCFSRIFIKRISK